MFRCLFGLLFCICLPQKSSGQLSLSETLNSKSICTSTPFTLDCGNALIAVERVQFAYRPGCESTCCTYNNTDCFVNSSKLETGDIRRTCSGHRSCILDLFGYRDFCSHGTLEPSYISVQYYCIPETRVTPICSSTTISSDGPPLYLINNNYPSVTTGDSTCSCSVEVYNCSSNINVYTIDVDLYYDTSYCSQHLRFVDGTNTTLKTISCEDYYDSSIVADTLSAHYLKVDFLDNEDEEQEGYFFLGLVASVPDVTFSISCSSEPESWCVGCDMPPSISNGYLELNEESNTNYEASATTFCDSGYKTESPQVTCLANASWENAVCTVRDCGPAPSVMFGNARLIDPKNSTYGAVVIVTCYPGYETNKTHILCLPSGVWDDTLCSPKDCGTRIMIAFGSAALDDDKNTIYGATAIVTCFKGYEASKENISCLQTGFWDTVDCSPIDCGPVIPIEHGQANLRDDGNTSFGAIADIECDPGYESTADVVECSFSGVWETVSSCLLKEQSDNAQTRSSKETNESLSPGIIALTVVLCGLGLVAGLTLTGYLVFRSRAVAPQNYTAEDPVEKILPEESQTALQTDNKEEHYREKTKPVPEVPKRHEIKHGHVYIDHGEAHIFGITIHLPHPFAHLTDHDTHEHEQK